MSRFKAERAMKRLLQLLSLADDEELCRLIWAVRELQTRGGTAHERVFVAPPEARTTDISTGHYVMPWMLETLVNELLTTSKARRRPNEIFRSLDCEQWTTLTHLHDRLRQWEDCEEAISLKSVDILHIVDRYAHQQFQWQRGNLNAPSFYRSARLYGGEKATAWLRASGLSVNAMSATGVAIYGALARNPYVEASLDLTPIGISREEQAAVAAKISIPISEARREARSMRARRRHPAHARSILRRYPAFSGMLAGGHLLVPLPELVLARVTTGIYYDVIGGGSEVRNEIGKNFETYTAGLLEGTLDGIVCKSEYEYRNGKQKLKSPDIIATNRDGVCIIAECKATRMSFETKFGDKAATDGDRGFEEIAKGAFQIWRFMAHCRLGRTGEAPPADTLGLVVTLDTWLQISWEMKSSLLERAKAIAREKCAEIDTIDMIDIAFYSIENFEQVLLTLPDEAVLRQMRIACESGSSRRLPDELEPGDGRVRGAGQKPYPFLSDLGNVLPWTASMPTQMASGQ